MESYETTFVTVLTRIVRKLLKFGPQLSINIRAMQYSPADLIDGGDGEEVGGQLECGGNGEGDVDAVVDVGDVADVAVEEEPRHHPGTSNDS